MSTNTNYPFDTMFDRMLGMSRVMDPAFTVRPSGAPSSAGRSQLWLPAVDTYETEQSFVVEADLPGVPQDQIDLHFEQGTLTISGRRAATLPTAEQPRSKLRVYASERTSGAFSRSIRLPEYVDGEKITATYANGVLSIHIPKASAALPRKIAIQAEPVEAKQISA